MAGSSANATTILVFGILGLVLPCIGVPFGVAAWIMGNAALRELNAGFGDPSLRSQVEAGRILGIIGTILWGGCGACILAYYVVVVVLVLIGAAGSQGRF
ncbi:MAG: DUF4190 domain-containing protein [Fimbriimonadales bacterium]